MLLSSASIVGVFSSFIQIQVQLNLPIPWYVNSLSPPASYIYEFSFFIDQSTGTFPTSLLSDASQFFSWAFYSGSLQIVDYYQPSS